MEKFSGKMSRMMGSVNVRIIEEQQTEIAVLTYDLSKATRRTEVEKRLENLGSDLRDATEPAKQLK